MSIELKIKSKSLAEEAKIIRKEENIIRNQVVWLQGNSSSDILLINKLRDKRASLTDHRKYDVRNENRATYLARAFLNGDEYSSVEQKRNPSKEFNFHLLVLKRVLTMVNKYGSKVYDMSDIRTWLSK
jgi:hypothetical protein